LNIKTKTSLVGFLLALATLNSPSTANTMGEVSKGVASQGGSKVAESNSATAPTTKPSLDQRLNRLNAAIRAREEQLPELSQEQNSFTVARGWADGRDREWVNGRRTGWADGYERDWVNVNPWRNGWSDSGSFSNYNPWRDGGGWVDRSDGSGFINSRY
jgi:rSAM-associated Gly-rich repeat protein